VIVPCDLTIPRTWDALDAGEVIFHFTDRPGPIVDSNAPPPPPGVAPATNPFLSGWCGAGRVMACSRVGSLLRATSSADEFVQKLRANGFEVREVHGSP
jgi:hypothetical protein